MKLSARASEIDSRAKEHPEINFVFASKDGKPADVQNASVDTSVEPRGKLVIWLMSHNGELFKRLNSYGLHAIQPHYANKWFGIVCQQKPVGSHCRGNVRLEAATGEGFSDEVSIPQPDGMMERSFQFVKWLAKENPEGKWDYFFNETEGRIALDGRHRCGVFSRLDHRDPLFQTRRSQAALSLSAAHGTSTRIGRLSRQKHQPIVFSDSLTCSTEDGRRTTTAAPGSCSDSMSLAPL